MSDVPTVHQRMAAVVQALTYIPKQRSEGVSYEFRGIDAVMGALHGPLADNGLYLSPRVLDDWQVNPIPGTNNRTQYQTLFRVCVDVYAEDGSHVTLGPGLAQSHDYGDKAAYQAQQNAIKYLLLEAFCIPTSEQDMDARSPDPSPTVDLSDLERVIAEAQALGLEGDYEGTREYAAQSQGHADTAAGKLRKAIAKHHAEQDDESSGTQAGAPAAGTESGERDASPSPAGAADPDTKQPSGEGETSPSPDTPAWRELAEAEGVTAQQVLIALQPAWPTNDQASKPARSKDLDAAAERHPELVANAIERLAQEKRKEAASA